MHDETTSSLSRAPARRAPELRRSWLFVPGGDRAQLMDAAQLGADALIQELEDFTPPQLRPEARAMAAEVFAAWRGAGIVACVRINPLEGDGLADLAGVIEGRPDAVHLPKVAEPAHVAALDAEITLHERRLGLPPGGIEIVPNIETARGIMQTYAIATASPRVSAVLCSTEDLAEDLGAPRSRAAIELAYARQRLHLEARAAKVVSIDCPYTFADAAGCEADARAGRQLGYGAKSAVDPSHVAIINAVMTPSAADVREAEEIVQAFEAARAAGKERARRGDLLIEVPFYFAAKRLLARAAALGR
ncbi:HpcH/HpaI aldolase/citrate lyase family protein [Xanthobacter tagetidis]|uniref:CoA ester lyase n=1 Tax=Xanthobacter tagetidis TaxID=60216 RepID=A0A3L7ABA8_9HYPH|nr:CoA ester lyase [Xanthobacter tagetidis]MBB6306063.1 citrate lyase subunit beta/citryl-CoA lyase [Xanthobacter tagetidis]RLP77623.1 CoA ester lyase [Xanthobacter tagetidis]